MWCLTFLKSSQSILLPLHLICSFFSLTSLNFLTRVPITLVFFHGLDGSGLFVNTSAQNVLLKMLKRWLVLFLRLTLQYWPVIVLKSFFKLFWYGQLLSSWILRTFLTLDIFFFLFQLFSCGIVGLMQITFLLAISSTVIFVCFLFTFFNNFNTSILVHTLLFNLLTNCKLTIIKAKRSKQTLCNSNPYNSNFLLCEQCSCFI